MIVPKRNMRPVYMLIVMAGSEGRSAHFPPHLQGFLGFVRSSYALRVRGYR